MRKRLNSIVMAVTIAVAVNAGPVTAGPMEDIASADAAAQRGNFEKALGLIRPLAEQGNAKAQMYLALFYRGGHGVPKDINRALGLLSPLAEQGNAEAQRILADMYMYPDEDGKGIPLDVNRAFMWKRKAANQGDKLAILELSIWYDMGKGDVPKNRDEKIKWLLDLAKEGDRAAQVSLEKQTKSKETFDHLFKVMNGVPPVDTPAKPYKWQIGMTKEQVLGSMDRAPKEVNKTTTSSGTSEIWIYAGPTYLFFNERGVLKTINSPF